MTSLPWKPLSHKMKSKKPFSLCQEINKAPGPDGVTGAFCKACWEIIKDDLNEAFNSWFALNSQGSDLLYSANILLLKKLDGLSMTDFRPISLIHSTAKIFTKLLTKKLTPLLDSMVLKCHSAFIKKRSIHDNFLYVQDTVGRLHRSKIPALLMKLDFQKAFDSIKLEVFARSHASLGFALVQGGGIGCRSSFAQQALGHFLTVSKGLDLGMDEVCTKGTPSHPCSSFLLWTNYNGFWTSQPSKASLHSYLLLLHGGGHPCMLMMLQSSSIQRGRSYKPLKKSWRLSIMQQDYRSILRKSSILPIRCEDIDLDHCSNPSLEHVVPFHDVSLVCSSTHDRFKKSMCSLSLSELGKDCQDGKGECSINRAVRLTLVTSGLSSMPTYH